MLLAPACTLRMMGTGAPADALAFVRYVGAFVLSTGVACALGALALQRGEARELRMVWLLTAVTRALVAAMVVAQVAAHALDGAWVTVAAFDGLLAMVQFVAVAKGWHERAARG